MARVIDDIAREEIRAAMNGLSGKRASAEAARLAEAYDVSVPTIYTLSADVRPSRKPRADKGKRTASLTEDAGLLYAAELVADLHLAPMLALENARLNGYEINVSAGTFERYLREHGLSRRQRLTTRRPHRRFEEDAPGKRFHYDDSGLKQRWFVDTKTRKILRVSEAEVNANHPNLNPERVQVWSLVLVDDFSRRRYVRYVAADHLDSAKIGAFLLAGFREMGVPLVLYTDNAKPLRSKRLERAAQLLNKAFESTGGFRLERHAPLNSQATGKFEISHKWLEEHHRLLAINGDDPTLETLNYFAANMCERYNWRPHRDTGEAPLVRWQNVRSVVRVAPPAILDAAFLAQEFTVTLRADLTIKIQGQTLQLPRESNRENKLLDWAALGHKVTVVLPHQADWLVVIGQDGTEIIVDHTPFKADTAGDYKAVADTAAEKLRKTLKASRKARLKEKKQAGERFAVQLVDAPDERQATPLMFPKPAIEIEPAQLAEISGASALLSAAGARVLDYFDALDWLREHGLINETPDAATVARLQAVFGSREQIDEVELRAAWDAQPAETADVPSTTNVIPLHRKLA